MSNTANNGNVCCDETKIIYYIDEEETPYLIKLAITPDKVTLGDFKNALNRPHYKYFFKSVDFDFGVVKEEITDDDSHLPYISGRIISWLVTAEGSNVSDTADTNGTWDNILVTKDKTIEPRNVPFHLLNHKPSGGATTTESDTVCDTCTDTDSVYSAAQDRVGPLRSFHEYKPVARAAAHSRNNVKTSNGSVPIYETNSSMMSSDLESTSFFDSEDESSRFSTTTGTTMSSRYCRQKQQQRRRRRPPAISRASSFSSITDSTMSLNIMTVRLPMDTVKFLGISIVGQSNKGGDGGIYVGSIMKGGAVSLDGRIEPGDMILEVNDLSFEDMSNDDAVRTLREQVQKSGPITLVVAKCWDPNPKGYFTIPRQEPVRPIDPRAWVLHTNAMAVGAGEPQPSQPLSSTNGVHPQMSNLVAPPSMQSLLSGGTMLAGTSAATFNAAAFGYMGQAHQQVASQVMGPGNGLGAPPFFGYPPGPQGHYSQGAGSIVTTSSSLPESERYQEDLHLTVNTDIGTVVRVMSQPESGLDIRDRLWLKITLPNAFIGSDLVDWLYRHLEGFLDRKEARKYAATLLKFGYIRHTVNKATFSEQCYYVLGVDGVALNMSRLSLSGDPLGPADAIVPSECHPAALPPPNWVPATAPCPSAVLAVPSTALDNQGSNGAAGTVTATASSNSQYSVLAPLHPPPPSVLKKSSSRRSVSGTSSSSSSTSSSNRSLSKVKGNHGVAVPKPPPRTAANPLPLINNPIVTAGYQSRVQPIINP